MTDRYDAKGNSEGQYQPGSQDLVLLNKLDIVDPQEMENTEFDYLIQFQLALFDELSIDQQITSKDLCEWHHSWLGDIYDWAGNYRTVTISKGGFPFAAVPQLAALMDNFDKKFLQKYTPCNNTKRDDLC